MFICETFKSQTKNGKLKLCINLEILKRFILKKLLGPKRLTKFFLYEAVAQRVPYAGNI